MASSNNSLLETLFGRVVASALRKTQLPENSLAKASCEAWGVSLSDDLRDAPPLSEKATNAINQLVVLAKAKADLEIGRALIDPIKKAAKDPLAPKGQPAIRAPKPPAIPTKAPTRLKMPKMPKVSATSIKATTGLE